MSDPLAIRALVSPAACHYPLVSLQKICEKDVALLYHKGAGPLYWEVPPLRYIFRTGFTYYEHFEGLAAWPTHRGVQPSKKI